MASKNKTNKKAAKPAKKVTKPAAKKAAKPAKKAAKPAPKKAAKPAKKAAKPAPKKVAKPAKKAAKPAPKKAVKPAKKAVKPAPKKVAKPAKKAPVKAKPVAKKPVAKPVAKKAAPKAAPKKEEKKAVKPVVKAVAPSKPAAPAKKEETKHEVRKSESRADNKRPAHKDSILKKTVDVKSLPKPPVPLGKPTTMLLAKPKVMEHTKAGKADERTRYSDEELKEFKEIILKKLAEARKDLDLLRSSLTHTSDNGTDDTSPTFKMMEDGSETLSREETAQLAGRQEKFIQALEAALIRIENKTYGICRITGKLINKERLKLVPHTTLSIEAKNLQN